MNILTVRITGAQGTGKSRLAEHIQRTFDTLTGGKVVILEGDEPAPRRSKEHQIEPNDVVIFTNNHVLYSNGFPYRHEIFKGKEGQYREVSEAEYKTYLGPKRMIQILQEITEREPYIDYITDTGRTEA